ncbi:MAG: UDP-glucose 4-epimerase GalE [Deltaproteobacteria bacterium CG11_big_fil_rev_8_21_14_0_20_47_16]|nr:MAG: UDP-glucose 4-epimerase GalE [Deltaproteobacteria bacterium CG11_big_fil_rev_8_21_14_0_20_47_16]
MNTILVTGGAGYIGSHTCRQLNEAGFKLVLVDSLYTGHRWAVPKNAKFIEGDAGDIALMSQLMRDNAVSAVIHFAGYTVVPESVANPLKYYANNTCASRNLIAACTDSGVKNILFSSTAAVYGVSETTMVDETSPTNPINPYGESKLMVEKILADVAKTGAINYVALRYFNVAGAQPDGSLGQATPEATHLIKVACEAACGKRDHVDIYGTDFDTADGTGIRDYIHVVDLANAHVAALDYLLKGGKSEIMNCGYGQGSSVREVLNMVMDVSGKKFKCVEKPRRAGDPPALIANSDKIQRVLGWKPQYNNLRTICETAYNWETHGKV